MHWFAKHNEEILQELSTNPNNGLTTAEVKERLEKYGHNALQEAKPPSGILLFLKQFENPLLIILIIGSVVSFFTGHLVDGIAIAVIVFINAVISFLQEYKAQKSLASLKEMAAPSSMVLRDTEWSSTPTREIVPGDILKLNTGDIVGADMRLLTSVQLQIDESALTGESVPVEKTTQAIPVKNLGIGDQTNMGFMSTVVTGGNGIAVVTATGMQTEVGHIAEMLTSSEEVKTPLQRRLQTLSHMLIGAALAIVAVIIGIGLHHGMDFIEILNTGISLSVAAIPEGLPTVLTIVLTLGSQRMVKQKALARQLSSVETLGSTSVICSDKTGTLTQNQMQVTHLAVGGSTWTVTGQGFEPQGEFIKDDEITTKADEEPDLHRLLIFSALCNDAVLLKKDDRHTVQGNPTEGALVVAAAKAGISRDGLLEQGYEVVQAFPFDSTRKMMSVIIRDPDKNLFVVAKGAPDVILRNSKHVDWHARDLELSDEYHTEIERTIDGFGTKALRTLALGYKAIDDHHLDLDQDTHETELTFIGIHGIIDPPRPEVIDAIDECWSAGIRTVMITGDHAATAQAIAEQIGIKRSKDDLVITGAELNETSDPELKDKVDHVAVFARVSPEHKLRIVKALQERNYVAAMTGDGVNDAPALRQADIGIAMGITGTQVAKDASSLVLLDDNFSTIVTAVREGRRIYDNILKFIRQALTANVAEVSAILFAFLMSADDPLLPLTALMILWINLVSDGLPALALGVDNPEGNLMKRLPRSRHESFFANQLGARIVIRGLTLGWLTYFMFTFALDGQYTMGYAQTVAFTTLIFAQLFHVFDSRTFTSIYRRNPFANTHLLLAVFGSAALSLLMVYTPFGQLVLKTEPLELRHLIMVIAIASLPTFLLSAVKEVFGFKWL